MIFFEKLSTLRALHFCIILIATTIETLAQGTLIAHYTFYKNASDSLGLNGDAETKNVQYTDSSVYLDGNYYWDDNMGSHIQIGPISGWDPEHFRLSLDIKMDSLSKDPGLPIIVLGSSWRWMHANVTSEGKIEWALDDTVIETTDSVIELEKWTPVVFERDSSQGIVRFVYNNSDTLEVQIDKINHNNDRRISASHGGSGKTFKGYWRNLKVYNTRDVMTSHLSAPESFVHIYPNPVRDYLVIENKSRASFKASLYATSGRKIHTLKILPFSAQKVALNTPTTGIYYLELKNENQRLVRKIVWH